MSSGTFYCDCNRLCKGKRKSVSKTTFYKHRKLLNPVNKFSPRFQDFLSKNPVVPTSSPSTSRISRTSHRHATRNPDGIADVRSMSGPPPQGEGHGAHGSAHHSMDDTNQDVENVVGVLLPQYIHNADGYSLGQYNFCIASRSFSGAHFGP